MTQPENIRERANPEELRRYAEVGAQLFGQAWINTIRRSDNQPIVAEIEGFPDDLDTILKIIMREGDRPGGYFGPMQIGRAFSAVRLFEQKSGQPFDFGDGVQVRSFINHVFEPIDLEDYFDARRALKMVHRVSHLEIDPRRFKDSPTT